MPTRKSNPKQLNIDGNSYIYWVRELPYDDTDAVPLNVVIRADYGSRSTCTLIGIRNRERWHDYPNWNPESVIAITPKVIRDLIHYAHRAGWDPASNRANLTLEIDNSFASGSSALESEGNDA